jgi:hypothetical protein
MVTAEAGAKRFVVLDPGGKVLRTVPFECALTQVHLQVRLVRTSPSGTWWLAGLGEGLAREYGPEGEKRRTVQVEGKHPHRLYTAQPLAGGHVLLATAGLGILREVDGSGATVWEFTPEDGKVQGVIPKWISGVHLLSNGHILAALWQSGNEVRAFEITKEKKVVWKLTARDGFEGITSVQELNTEGTAPKEKGPP